MELIPVTPPFLEHTDYFNRKGWYSIILQGVVDHNYLFEDIYVGWPGNVHDARVLAHSSIYAKASHGEIFPEDKIKIKDTDVPIFLIGDSAYPLTTWIMKPFAHNTSLTIQQKNYNYALCRARTVVENGFGRLKARWRRLLKRIDMDVDKVPNIITACCILHNLCEINREHFNDLWLEEVDNSNQPPCTPSNVTSNDAKDIREALVYYYNSDNC